MRLSKLQWAEARSRWEADPRAGFQWLALEIRISRAATNQMASKCGWKKLSTVEQITKRTLPRKMSYTEINNSVDGKTSGFIYVIETNVGGSRYQNIGCATNVYEKLNMHQASSPFELRIVLAYLSPDMILEEQAIHSMFSHKAVRAQWFQLDKSDLAEISIRSYNRA